MAWLLHFSVPALAAFLVVVLSGSAGGWVEGVVPALSHFGENYLFFSAPYLAWWAVANYFGASRRAIFGGYSGAHALLAAVAILVFRSPAPEAANGWLLYLIGSPVAIAIGASLGAWFEHRTPNRAV